MNPLRPSLLGFVVAFAALASAYADEAVVASLKPVHSLVAGVMQGVGEPAIIVDGAGSPHSYSLRPSQARDLEQAQVIVWIGPQMEAFLEAPIETLGRRARVVELAASTGLVTLALREGGAFKAHPHDDQDRGHGPGAFNMHLWLDPDNAKVFVYAIEAALSAYDPANAARYAKNAEALAVRLDALTAELSATLEPVKDRPFVVFHDAYQYFENRFDLRATGSITVSPEVMPGAERIAEIRGRLREVGATCVFSEPQFKPSLISVVTEGTTARVGVLDPLGTEIANGPDLYFTLMRNMARSMKDCLGANS